MPVHNAFHVTVAETSLRSILGKVSLKLYLTRFRFHFSLTIHLFLGIFAKSGLLISSLPCLAISYQPPLDLKNIPHQADRSILQVVILPSR
jgi:hypothetical protein